MIRILEEEFDAAYAILEESFPSDERRPKNGQKALFSKEEYRMYGVKENGTLCGFCAVWTFPEFLFLEHLAVTETHRSRGLGAAMLRELCGMGRVVLEVEPPETELARRRIGFYERCGFFYNDYDYTQPPIFEGKQPIPLRIMTYGGAVCEAEFCAIRDVLYSRVYHVKEETT